MKMEEARRTEAEIDVTREVYRPVSVHASVLFFCISDLGMVDPMYQYSLAWFINLYEHVIEHSDDTCEVAERTGLLIDQFTYSLYLSICRSLFERHKLMFSFLLAVKILQQSTKGLIDPHEWRYLLAGGSATIERKNPAPNWLTEESWMHILQLSKLENFQGFAENFALNIRHYKEVFDSAEAHLQPLDPNWDSKLNSFQKLCFLNALRPDKVTDAIRLFIEEHLDTRYTNTPPLDITACYKDSEAETPLIFVLSAGADPMADLMKVAEDMRFGKKFEKVSLGQGQGPKAEKLIQVGPARDGSYGPNHYFTDFFTDYLTDFHLTNKRKSALPNRLTNNSHRLTTETDEAIT
jgi:dynein heavy chain